MTKMLRIAYFYLAASLMLFQSACSMNDLPRNMSLKAFDPHRKDFTCKFEENAVPPIDPLADEWFREGLAATSHDKWPSDRNYQGAAELWQKAAERKHWKAMLNLAGAYARGEGVPRDAEHAVQIVEAAMRLGIPAAYDLMGTYYSEGLGVNQDESRAYAFWELAAYMGSPKAMAFLGKAMSAVYDSPRGEFWANRSIAIKMLECGYAQKDGDSAFELGLILDGTDKTIGEDEVRALTVLHDSVKYGSDSGADYLFSSFDSGDKLVAGMVDHARSARYFELGDALRRNPDLRLPNLDKILPLPPAELPKWDGNKQTLVDAAKPVVPGPVPKASPGARREGRAYLPDGWILSADSIPAVGVGAATVAQYESTAARLGGYWLPQLLEESSPRHTEWNRAQFPQRYERDEPFEPHRKGLVPSDGRVMWHYVGVPTRPPAPPADPRVVQGVARVSQFPRVERICPGDAVCPLTGVWLAQVGEDHPRAASFNQWNRQSYVQRGGSFPTPHEMSGVVSPEVMWKWLGNANQVAGSGVAMVTLG